MPRNKFTSEQARAAGRKSRKNPSLDSLKDVQDIRSADVRKMISMYMGKSVSELKLLAQDESISGIQAVIIRQVLVAIEKGDFGGLDQMLARVLGKVPNQNINENIDKTARDEALDKVPREKIIELVKAGNS